MNNQHIESPTTLLWSKEEEDAMGDGGERVGGGVGKGKWAITRDHAERRFRRVFYSAKYFKVCSEADLGFHSSSLPSTVSVKNRVLAQ